MKSAIQKHLHIISFNVPYPPDYGGIIDVLYKIKWLKKVGINIHLHAFVYEREPQIELEPLCEKVYYYKRRRSISTHISSLPYIVRTRDSGELLKRLQKDNYPILFEGLHSCFFLNHPSVSNRLKLVRMHNIEHEYYLHLACSTRNIIKKIFHAFESLKLYFFEHRLKYANHILSISAREHEYISRKYGNSFLIPAFHKFEEPGGITGKGKYILLHGDLSVPENIRAVKYIVSHLRKKIDFPLIIAGRNPADEIIQLGNKYRQVKIIITPEIKEMHELIRNSHIIILHSFQKTGVKIKLIDSLYLGRFVIANNIVLHGTGMESICERADEPNDLIKKTQELLEKTFDRNMISIRKNVLSKFSNRQNAEMINMLLT